MYKGLDAVLPAAALAAAQIADPATGLPTNELILYVADESGLSNTVTTTITIFGRDPLPDFDANPDPSPINVAAGTASTQLDGTKSSHQNPAVGIATFQWDVDNDGTIDANGAIANVQVSFDPVPDALVNRPVRLIVTDDNGTTAEIVKNVGFKPPPTPPSADADPTDPPEQDYQILEGENVAIDASQTSDADEGEPFFDYIAEISLDCDNDGEFDIVRSRNNAADPLDLVFVLDAAAQANCGMQSGGVENVVVVRARDALGAANTDSATVQVYGTEPIPVAETNAAQAGCNQALTFTCANSSHENKRDNPALTRCDWDFDNDGVFDAQGDPATDVQYAFGGFGDFDVLMRLTDENGNTADATLAISVDEGNHPPTAALAGPIDAISGQGITLSAAGSKDGDPGCGASIRYNISFTDKDGNAVSIDSGDDQIMLTPAQVDSLLANATDPANMQPVAIVTLAVTDSFGLEAEAQAQVRVYDNLPIVDLTSSAQQVACDIGFNLDASASHHGHADGQLANFSFDLDDDGTFETDNGANPVIAASLTESGDANFSVQVTDSEGRVATASTTVTMTFQNVAPITDADPDYNTAIVNGNPLPVDLDARGSRDPNAPCDSIVSYSWDLNNDGVFGDANGAEVLGYVNAGWQRGAVQIIAVQATDEAGLSSVDQALIRVQDEPSPDVDFVQPAAGEQACGLENEIVLAVSDPEGDVVTVTVLIGAVELSEQDIDTPDDGSDVEVRIPWDVSGYDDGDDYRLSAEAVDPKGGAASATSDAFGISNVDTDGDGVLDCNDNCPDVANADRLDTDGDGDGVVVEEGVEIGQNAQVGDDDVLEENVVVMVDTDIGAGAVIGAGAGVAPHVDVGENAEIGANVVLSDRVEVGDNVELSENVNVGSSVVIGEDTTVGADSDIEFSAQVGAGVGVGEEVFVGASVVGDDVAVGDNAFVGNNNEIGDGCIIEAGAAIWDRVTLGARCFIGANRIIENDVTIGDDASIGAVTNSALTISSGTQIGNGTSFGVDTYTYGSGGTVGMRNTISDRVIVGGNWFGLVSTYGDDNIVGDDAQLWVGQSMGSNNEVGAGTQLQTSCVTGNGNFFGPGLAIGPNAVFGNDNTVTISLPGGANYGSGNLY